MLRAALVLLLLTFAPAAALAQVNGDPGSAGATRRMLAGISSNAPCIQINPSGGNIVVSATGTTNDQSGAGGYVIASTDACKEVLLGGSFSYTIPAPTVSGFGAGFSVAVKNWSATGSATITITSPGSATFKGGSNTATLTLVPGAWAILTSTGSQYNADLGGASSSGTAAILPLYSPPNGNYGVLYTGSASPTGSDSNFTLLSTNTAAATWTMPRSCQSSGTPTGCAATIFPTGTGICFKNAGTAPLTITATTSTIAGAQGVVSGSAAARGGPFTLFQDGEACLQANASNNYEVTKFNPGVWYQFASSVTALTWTFPAYASGGYPEYRLRCSGIIPAVNGDHFGIQVAYNGTFQTTGYQWVKTSILQNVTTVGIFYNTGIGPTGAGDTSMKISDSIDNTSVADYDGSNWDVYLTQAQGTGAGNKVVATGIASWFNSAGGEGGTQMNASGPYSTNAVLTGIQIIDYDNSSNAFTGMCRLEPSL